MSESGPASAVSLASSAKEDGPPHAFGVRRPVALRRLTLDEIDRMASWGNFPRKHRRFYIAQNGKCPYCGRHLKLIGSARAGLLTPRTYDAPTAEHVLPKSKGGKLWLGNKLVAHALCNAAKGHRKPYPCEKLFAEITGDLIVAMLPLTAFSTYLPAQQISQEPDAHGEEDRSRADY